jgi:hypothetical protein
VWHRHYGKWWMVQWAFDGWLSFGVHLDFRHRKRGDGTYYGPYIDIHFLCFVFSLGWLPIYAGDIDLHVSTAIARELG